MISCVTSLITLLLLTIQFGIYTSVYTIVVLFTYSTNDVNTSVFLSLLLVCELMQLVCFCMSIEISGVMMLNGTITFIGVFFAVKVDNSIANTTSAFLIVLLISLCCMHVLVLVVLWCVNSDEYVTSYFGRCYMYIRSKYRRVVGVKRYVQLLPSIENELNEGESEPKESKECSICLSNSSEGASTFVRLPCQHLFHQTCIDGWLENHDSCPNCRANV